MDQFLNFYYITTVPIFIIGKRLSRQGDVVFDIMYNQVLINIRLVFLYLIHFNHVHRNIDFARTFVILRRNDYH